MPRLPGEPVARPADKAGFDLVVQGRATDPIKGIDFAAKLVRHLRAEGVDVRLTVRGAPPPTSRRRPNGSPTSPGPRSGCCRS